jgi:hypothetical protein
VSSEVAHLDAEVEVDSATDGPARITVSYHKSGAPKGVQTPFVTTAATFMPAAM